MTRIDYVIIGWSVFSVIMLILIWGSTVAPSYRAFFVLWVLVTFGLSCMGFTVLWLGMEVKQIRAEQKNWQKK